MEETTLETLEVSALNLLEVTLWEVMERGMPALEMLSESTAPETRLVLGNRPFKIGETMDGAIMSLSLSLFKGYDSTVRAVV